MEPVLSLPSLDRDEVGRYHRHLILPEFGETGQRRLKQTRVLIVGAGGLGSPAALYLAAAGVGRIGLVDFDVVDATNLQRQILYGTASVGRGKLAAAAERLADLNPRVEITCHETRLERENALELIGGYDLVLDGADNFPTRYLVNDACVMLGKPNVHGSIFRFEGQASVFDATRGPCYRCLYPEPPPPGAVPSCAEAGVLGVLPGVIGTLQAIEAVKLAVGIGEPLIGRLLVFDALGMRFQELTIRKDPACALCGPNPTVKELVDYEAWCGVATTPGEDVTELKVKDLAAARARGDDLVLVDVREPHEWKFNRLEGAIHIPLRTLPDRVNELDRGRTLVIYCHHGNRSRVALEYLRGQGFTNVKNLTGGIEAWSREVDPSVPRY
jgi:sulfur-carrier protein adenylyltransferase/sulfurtransferase